jgi:hypothetical protein
MNRTETKIITAWEELNQHLDVKVHIGVDTIRYCETTAGKVFLTRDRLIELESSEPYRTHCIPLENIDRVHSTYDKNWSVYKALDERQHFHGKCIVALHLKLKDKAFWFCFAPKTDSDYKMQGNMAMLSALWGGFPSSNGIYDQQVRTANRWQQLIKETIQARKVILLEQNGLVQAWKCEYCQTLNEAEKEKCSYCGSPRRK